MAEPGATSSNIMTRLERMLTLEGIERQRVTCVRISVALLIIAPLLAVLAGLPEAFYYHVLLLLFVAVTWFHYLCARLWPTLVLIDYVFVAASFALLSFTLIYPNPLSEWSQYPFGPSVELRSNDFVFFFLMLAGLAFGFSPWLLMWGGICGAAFWSLGRWWIMTRPGVGVFDPSADAPADASIAALIEASQHPRYVDVGVWVQEVIVFLIVAALLALVVQGSRELLLRRAIEERRGANLARYLPAQMADRIAESDTPFLEDRQAQAAVLFTDLVGFTRWAEAHTAQEVMAMLRETHGMVAEEVFRAEGVMDKFIGDGAMATFGVTEGEVAPAARALDCVEAILARANAYNKARVARGEVAVPLSVGAHYGPVTIGDVGSEGRLELAVLGDTVNVASRLEALTRPLSAGAVVSDDLIQAAGGPRTGWTPGGEQWLRGRGNAVTIWTRERPHD